jgi:hypothetical protein
MSHLAQGRVERGEPEVTYEPIAVHDMMEYGRDHGQTGI